MSIAAPEQEYGAAAADPGCSAATPRCFADEILQYLVASLDASCGSLAISSGPDHDGDAVVASTCRCAGQGVRALHDPAGTAGHCVATPAGAEAAERQSALTSPRTLSLPLSVAGDRVGQVTLGRLPPKGPFTQLDRQRAGKLVAWLAIVVRRIRTDVAAGSGDDTPSRAVADGPGITGRLQNTPAQLLQSEKMASIGQLAAGVAHEINNPIGYVHSNLRTLEGYVADIFRLLEAYSAIERENPGHSRLFAQAGALRTRLDIDFVMRDMHDLLAETREGITRVRKIVQDLKDFSRTGAEDEWQWSDLHKGLDLTLSIVQNEIKYKAKVVKEYGNLPEIECLPSQLNQVFMNLLVNASQAIGESGTITIRTGVSGKDAWVEISDTGCGIPGENLKHVFEPFFTTKPVGKGTGLGLSLSYSIVQKHGGRIDVQSEAGRGSTFRVILPCERAATVGASTWLGDEPCGGR